MDRDGFQHLVARYKYFVAILLLNYIYCMAVPDQGVFVSGAKLNSIPMRSNNLATAIRTFSDNRRDDDAGRCAGYKLMTRRT